MKLGTFLIGTWLLLALAACDTIAPSPTPTLPAEVVRGRQVFERNCATCHSTTPDMIVVGPSLAGIATRAATRIPGMDAEAYIRESIAYPGNYTVEGFREGIMPDQVIESLAPEDFEAVVDYLMTLE
ncbi:MAG TPA: cytochrome c [Anaerolineales bacterium]|nr:cytochrome c [Anaerolineales bacterium]